MKKKPSHTFEHDPLDNSREKKKKKNEDMMVTDQREGYHIEQGCVVVFAYTIHVPRAGTHKIIT